MLLCVTGIGYAIANQEKSPQNLSHSELTRGSPTELVYILPLKLVPCEIAETRNCRDVDVRNRETTIIIASEAAKKSS
jgi:hypothetical protein